MIADFLTDDDPLAQELKIHASTQQSGSAGIRPGQVLSLLDIEDIPTPRTAIERAQLYHSAARTLLDIVAAILEERENRQ